MASASAITVYTKAACPQCKATEHYLKKAALEYQKVDVTEDPEAYDYITSLGYSSVPVVVAGDQSWYGFSPDRIQGLADVE